MHLTRFTDYGLRVLMYLALNEPHRTTVPTISETFGISHNHLVKVVNRLGQLGYVTTTRGTGGGIRLAKAATDIRVGQVIRDIEANLTMADCNDPPCPIYRNCRLVGLLDGAKEAFLDHADQATLADLTQDYGSFADMTGKDRTGTS